MTKRSYDYVQPKDVKGKIILTCFPGRNGETISFEEDIFIEELNNSTDPLTRDYILQNIWGYSSDADTHTLETHIYRLRQKIKNSFDDDNFIKNSKTGYYL